MTFETTLTSNTGPTLNCAPYLSHVKPFPRIFTNFEDISHPILANFLPHIHPQLSCTNTMVNIPLPSHYNPLHPLTTTPKAPIRKRAAARLSSTKPSPRTTTTSTIKSSTSSSLFPSNDSLPSTKLDQRRIKHSLLLSRVAKSAKPDKSARRVGLEVAKRIALTSRDRKKHRVMEEGGGVGDGVAKKPTRRSRKRSAVTNAETLATSLTSLLDALPSTTPSAPNEVTRSTAGMETESARIHSAPLSTSANTSTVRSALATGKSLSSRRGFSKRREGLARAEAERFGRNMGVMSAGGNNQEGPGGGVGKADDEKRSERWAALRRHIAMTTGAGGSAQGGG